MAEAIKKSGIPVTIKFTLTSAGIIAILSGLAYVMWGMPTNAKEIKGSYVTPVQLEIVEQRVMLLHDTDTTVINKDIQTLTATCDMIMTRQEVIQERIDNTMTEILREVRK